jgi:hypothetical protein
MTTQLDAVERFHRRDARDKQLDPPVRSRCSKRPRCPTGWERLPNSPYCLHCHTLMVDYGDVLRARALAREGRT